MSWLNERPRPVPSPGRFGREDWIDDRPVLAQIGRANVELAGFDISSSWKAERHAQCGIFFAGLLGGNLVGPCRPRQRRLSAKLGVLALSKLFPPVRLGWSRWAFRIVG